MGTGLATLLEHLELSVAAGSAMCDTVAGLREWEMRPDQLKVVRVLEHKLESLQDQVCSPSHYHTPFLIRIIPTMHKVMACNFFKINQ